MSGLIRGLLFFSAVDVGFWSLALVGGVLRHRRRQVVRSPSSGLDIWCILALMSADDEGPGMPPPQPQKTFKTMPTSQNKP